MAQSTISRPSVVQLVRRPVRDTPGRLLTSLTVVVVAAAGFGVLGYLDLRGRADAAEAARAEARNLQIVQSARTRLVTADSRAADGLLLGPDATAIQQRQYDYAIRRASLDLALASRDDARDRVDLALAGRWLTTYSGQVATVPAAGRGAVERLQQSSEIVRAQILPRLDRVQAASAARLAENERRLTSGSFGIVAFFALLLLVGAQIWLAVASHRIVNPGLALATVLVIVAVVGGATLAGRSESRAEETAAGPSAAATALVLARVAAFDARATETLALTREGGDAGNAGWTERIDDVRWRLTQLGEIPGRGGSATTITEALDGYQAAHEQVRQLQAQGRYEEAVAQSVREAPGAPGEVGGATGEFEEVDILSAAALGREQYAVDVGLRAAGRHLGTAAWAVLLAGLVAAGLAWAGVARRLAEYR